jgi:hypothetical protein
MTSATLLKQNHTSAVYPFPEASSPFEWLLSGTHEFRTSTRIISDASFIDYITNA